jgi:hypothetical protein
MRCLPWFLSLALSLLYAAPAAAFCGFYVARGDAKLFNQASQVVIARDGNRTVITMVNDFQGEPSEFAMVVPVPAVLERGQIHVGDKAWVEHLDAFSAPRLVEYFDEDPCRLPAALSFDRMQAGAAKSSLAREESRARSLGVRIEARYTVGEYDILILSANQSRGLETWLRENGYRLPAGISPILASYLKQNLKFFVAKVNLEQHSRLGFTSLRPLQMAFESPKFMLPIRLGTVNAKGPQELFIFTLTPRGRVETLNYRTVRLPEGMDLPVYVKDEFGSFYRTMFDRQVRRHDMRVVFLEHFWDMSWCDPCASEPLSNDELRNLGAFWLGGPAGAASSLGVPGPAGRGAPARVFVTRLHVRYDAAHFPEDLVFQETSDQQNFQARYVLRHPWRGSSDCPEVRRYRDGLRDRFRREAASLAELTGWRTEDIRRRMKVGDDWGVPEPRWWEQLWPEGGSGGR